MHISQLPEGAIQYIIDLLPRDIVERLLEFDNWVTPYAFKKYYARIKVIDNPNQFNKSTSYGGVERPEIVPFPSFTPYYHHEEDVYVFGSLFSLSQFIKRNPEYIATEITLETLTSFVRLAYEYQNFLKKASRIRLIQLDDSAQDRGMGGALTQSFKLLHRVFNNIHCEVFKVKTELVIDALDIPQGIRHIDITHGKIENFKEFWLQHPQIESLEVSNLFNAPTSAYPESLSYVGTLTPISDSILTVKVPDTVQVLSISGRPLENSINLQGCTSLKHLELSPCSISENCNLLVSPNLETLRLSEIVSNYGLSTLLPTKTFLRRLEIIGFFGMKFYRNLFYEFEFPETLEQFYFENSNLCMDSSEYSEGVFPHPYLNDVFDLRINHNVKFPNNLKVLHLSCPFTAIDSSWKIPPNVTKLELMHISYIVDFPGLVLPFKLENFFVEPIYGLISEHNIASDIINFPKSLVSFTYYGKPVECLQTNVLQLPNLKNLVFASHGLEGHNERFFINGTNIGNCDFSNLHNLQTFELYELPKLGELSIKLPNSLRKFRIAMSEVDGFARSFEFPRNLESLVFEQIGIDLNILNKLPWTLEHLELLECKTKMPTYLQLNLPHLRCLVMNECGIDQKTFNLFDFKKFSKLRDVGLQQNKIEEIDLSLFPESTTNLSVYKNNAKILYGNINLPNLRNLELSENDVQYHYDCNKNKFIIPEGIECLKMRNCRINQMGCIQWPKELGGIAMEINNLNRANIEYICKRYAGAKCFDSLTVTWDVGENDSTLQDYQRREILKSRS